MKATGVTRPIDSLGRVCLPKELRDSLDLQEDDRLEIFVEGNSIILRKYQNQCALCGENETEKLTPHYGKFICQKCRKELAK